MRSEVASRPLLLAFAGLCAGLALTWTWVGLPIAGFLAFFGGTWRSFLACGLGLALGWTIRPTPVTQILEISPGVLRGRVVSPPRFDAGGSRYVIRSRLGLLQVVGPATGVPTLGDEVVVRGRVGPLREGMALEGVRGMVRTSGVPIVLRCGPAMLRTASALSMSLLRYSGRHLSRRAATLTQAVELSETNGVDPELSLALRKTGTVHIISTSGLHVAVLAAAWIWVLAQLSAPRWLQVVLLCPLLALFAVAAGLSPPIVRACVMGVVGMAAYLFEREPDGLSLWSLAGFVWLVISPYTITDLGFLLSMSAVLGLVLFGSHEPIGWISAPAVLRFALNVMRISALAWLFTAPLVAFAFGELSISGIVANVLVVPLASLLLVSSLTAWLVAFIAAPIGWLVSRLAVEPIAEGIRWVVELLSKLPCATVAVPWFAPLWLVLIYGLLISLWRPKRRYAND